jgi:hypothetical protein
MAVKYYIQRLPHRHARDRPPDDLQPRGHPLHALHRASRSTAASCACARAEVLGGFYTLIGFVQLGWPALAGSAAAALFARAWDDCRARPYRSPRVDHDRLLASSS